MVQTLVNDFYCPGEQITMFMTCILLAMVWSQPPETQPSFRCKNLGHMVDVMMFDCQ